MDNDFATWLLLEMENRGLTQSALAKRAGVPLIVAPGFRSRKHWLAIALAFAAVVLIFLGLTACAPSTPPPTVTPAPTATPASTPTPTASPAPTQTATPPPTPDPSDISAADLIVAGSLSGYQWGNAISNKGLLYATYDSLVLAVGEPYTVRLQGIEQDGVTAGFVILFINPSSAAALTRHLLIEKQYAPESEGTNLGEESFVAAVETGDAQYPYAVQIGFQRCLVNAHLILQGDDLTPLVSNALRYMQAVDRRARVVACP